MSRRDRLTKELLVEPGTEANIAGRSPAWTGGPEFEQLSERQLSGTAIALLAIIAVTTIGFLQRIFDTVELSCSQWSACIGIAASLVVVEELIKLVIRQRDRRRVAATARLSASGA